MHQQDKITHTILLVEDEEFVREPFQMYLEHEGYEVAVAGDGEEALEKLEEQKIDVIISDLTMPRMNGFELIKRVAKERPKVPIIVLSGAGTLEAAMQALRLGAWDFLQKPLEDFNLLKHSLYTVLEKRKLIQMAERYQQLFEQSRRVRTEEREEELRLRKIIEEQLLKAKQEWEETVNFLPDPIALYTRDHRIIRLNKAMADALNVPAEEAVGERLCLLEECRGEEDENCPHSQLMRTENVQVSEIYNEKKQIHYEIKVLPFYELWESRIAGSVLHARDISERVTAQKKELELQSRMLHSQKLEAVGQLASGIAHEINTPAQYVSSNVDFLEEAFEDLAGLVNELQGDPLFREGEYGQKITKLLEECDWEYLVEEVPAAIGQTREGLTQISKIVRAMKEFSQSGNNEKQEANLNRIIDTTVTVARNEYKYDAELVLNLDPDLPSLLCLVDEMGQVVLNLIVNAAQAIGEAKELTETEEKGTITISTWSEDDNIFMEVTDTGTGIPEEIRNKIFEPFFTTKEVGRGTGQGLAIAYDVINDKHGGSITCTTELGRGTTFTIQLPIGVDAT